jgi:hypothetical protein
MRHDGQAGFGMQHFDDAPGLIQCVGTRVLRDRDEGRGE